VAIDTHSLLKPRFTNLLPSPLLTKLLAGGFDDRLESLNTVLVEVGIAARLRGQGYQEATS
jgi:hypothetical protein